MPHEGTLAELQVTLDMYRRIYWMLVLKSNIGCWIVLNRFWCGVVIARFWLHGNLWLRDVPIDHFIAKPQLQIDIAVEVFGVIVIKRAFLAARTLDTKSPYYRWQALPTWEKCLRMAPLFQCLLPTLSAQGRICAASFGWCVGLLAAHLEWTSWRNLHRGWPS